MLAIQWCFHCVAAVRRANAGLQYEMHLANGWQLTPRVNYAYTGGQFTSLTYAYITDYLPAHRLLSALLTLRIDEHWSVDAFANNLANEVYKSGQGLDNGNYYFYGPPREYGAHVTFRL